MNNHSKLQFLEEPLVWRHPECSARPQAQANVGIQINKLWPKAIHYKKYYYECPTDITFLLDPNICLGLRPGAAFWMTPNSQNCGVI